MQDVSFIKDIADRHLVFIRYTNDMKEYQPKLKKLVDQGLLLKSFPNLILTRKLQEILKNS